MNCQGNARRIAERYRFAGRDVTGGSSGATPTFDRKQTQREGPARCGGTGAARILYRSNRFIDNCGSYGDRAQNDWTGRR